MVHIGDIICMFLENNESININEAYDNQIIYTVIIAFAAIFSMIFSGIAIIISMKAYSTNKKMFKRQGVIDLHMAWSGTNDIDMENIITPDIVKAVNALSLTAIHWNHDIIEKPILYQSYWKPYKSIYNKLVKSSKKVPKTGVKCSELITPEIRKAYEDMDNIDLNKVLQTKL